jgi:hypothetical protein
MIKYYIFSIVVFLNSLLLFGQKETLFYDDFSSNKNDWKVGIDENLGKKIFNGKYVLDNKSASTYWVWNEFPLTTKINYSIEAKLKQVSGLDIKQYGIKSREPVGFLKTEPDSPKVQQVIRGNGAIVSAAGGLVTLVSP